MGRNLVAVCSCAVVLALAGCGGGGGGDKICASCAAGRVVGVAAGGAPVAGVLALVDSAGAHRSAEISDSGAYAIDVAGLSAPFLIEVAGTVGGRATVLHSLAVSADVGTNAVNVTPLTELLTAFVLGADPRAVFNSTDPDLSAVTADRLAAAEQLVAEKLAPVLQAYGVAGSNIRTAEFATDGTGMDGALDVVSVTPVQDESSGALRYQLTIATGSRIVFDPAQLGSLSLGALDQTLLSQLAAVLPEIDARLQALAGLFATGLPTPEALAPYFDAAVFRQNGLDLGHYLSLVLLHDSSFVGCAFSRPAVETADGVDRILVSFKVAFAASSSPPRRISWWMRKVNGAWIIEGNDQPADAGVTYLARLTSMPLTLEQIKLRADLWTWTASWTLQPSGEVRTVDCYGPTNTYYGVCDQTSNPFGVYVITGPWSSYDDPNTSTVDERQQTGQSIQYIGTPSARVRPYLVLSVSTTEVDARVDHVVVNGPGLPGAGVKLTWPKQAIPREYFILEGDDFDWNAFDSKRCGQMHPAPAGCGLDWSQVKAGSGYLFSFYEAGAVNPFETMTVQLLGRPRATDAWFADKDQVFPQFRLSAAQRFTVANIFDPAGGFKAGGTVTVDWSVPQDPTVSMESLWIWREYWIGNDSAVDANHRKEPHTFSLLGSTATHQACTFSSGPGIDDALSTWAWATVSARDIYGNALDHEVAPENPY